MDSLHRLLYLQNQSWFFPFKDDLRARVHRGPENLQSVFREWCERHPELRERSELPLQIPELNFSFSWILYGSPDYPESFYRMIDPPLVLTALGPSCWKNSDCISVVGSRKPTRDSLAFVQESLAKFVAEKNIVLVSGGARGVDQAVHSLALRQKRPTLVFLPSGLGQIYPSELASWVRSILECGGCFLSEYPLGLRMHKSFFHHRNRLIAQMGLVTLVVQAAAKSGTLMTGHLAAESGRPLWVVPGHPLQPDYRGNLELLQEGGTLVTSAEDLSLFFEVEKGVPPRILPPVGESLSFFDYV